MYKIKLVAILIVVGGLIAYIGDKIGMKVGKKRLSIFGLRPKHTSIMITICTGIVIALLSLSLLLVTSQNFRQALLNMQDVLTRLDRLTEQVKEKKADKLELEAKISQLTVQKEDLNQQIGNLAHNLGMFGRGYLQTLTADIVYHQGEILAAQVIDNSANIEQEVNKMVEKIKAAAAVTKTSYNQVELQEAVSFLDQNQGGILRLIAAKNVFAGGQLTISFDLYANYQVFAEETQILSLTVNNNSSIEETVNTLLAELNEVGIKNGMLPDNQGRVVKLNLIKFSQLVNQLRQLSGQKKIVVIAADNIMRADWLEKHIKFRLEEV